MIGPMGNPSIIPSAQRLAEANNVDWRTLQGSGDEGSVVERDVLAHLARVMLGEAETHPTPEPLPEGMRAWPEAERRREATEEVFEAPFTVPEPPAAEPEAVSMSSPWTLEKSPEPTLPSAEWDVAGVEAAAALPEAAPDTLGTVDKPFDFAEHDAFEAQADAPGPAIPPTLLVPSVPKSVYQAALDELETLKTRLGTLEEERSRHLGDLQQLPGLQETLELQKTELAKIGPLQSEVAGLRDQLAGAQAEAQRAHELAALNQDLEERLARARAFKEGAKAELGRIVAVNTALEGQLAALKKRSWW